MATDPDLPLAFTPAPIRRAAPEPLYSQVARDLAGHVRAGTMAPGRRLPAEPVLARAYGVNRLTVREALTSLARQGLVRRVQGVGSFVADAPVRHRIEAGQASIADALRGQGVVVREELLEAAPGPPEAVPGGPFPAFPGPVTILWVRRFVDDVPWSLSLTWLPAAPSDSEHLDVATGTPLIVLSGGDIDQHGRRIAQVAHRIRGDRAEVAIDFRSPA